MVATTTKSQPQQNNLKATLIFHSLWKKPPNNSRNKFGYPDHEHPQDIILILGEKLFSIQSRMPTLDEGRKREKKMNHEFGRQNGD